MNDNTIKSYKQGPKQAEPTATPVTYASLTDAINANPTEWAELDIKNGCFPIFGREIELPVIGNAYTLMVQGYMCELVEIAIFTNYLLHCSNTRIFLRVGEPYYYLSSDAPEIELERAKACLLSNVDKVHKKIGRMRISDGC